MSQETIVTLRGNRIYKIKNVKNGVLTRYILMDAIPETTNLFPNLIDIKIDRYINLLRIYPKIILILILIISEDLI